MNSILDDPQNVSLKGELHVWFIQMTQSDDRVNKNPQAEIGWREGDWRNPGIKIDRTVEATTWAELLTKVEAMLKNGPNLKEQPNVK
jgi:hypothetical protein